MAITALSEKTVSNYPSLYQVNVRVLLHAIAGGLGRPATLDDISDQQLDLLATKGFDWVWLLGVWQTGAAGRKVSATNSQWQEDFRRVLPDLREDDISGSPFAITGYQAHVDFGGDEALARMRARLHARGMRLMLDFVPNHTALDHPWVEQHPEFYVPGDQASLTAQPLNYVTLSTSRGPMIVAHGRDPYFPGWPDTLQLNYAEPHLQAAMKDELLQIAAKCDGVRCDMAMLLLPDVFERTWGLHAEPFWTMVMRAVRQVQPAFVLMAEVYWGLEGELQKQGFTYTYDKELYDRLREGQARRVRDHFRADPVYQAKSARFLENHDEPRAAAVFSWEMHQAAAVLTFLCPGLRFFHQGQLEGRSRGFSIHLAREVAEAPQPAIARFYERLLQCLERETLRQGHWTLLSCSPAWNGNWTWECFVCFLWQMSGDPPLLVAVNYSGNDSQCYASLPAEELWGRLVHSRDLMSSKVYETAYDAPQGFYLQLPPWGYQVLELTAVSSEPSAD
jgi:hypothetical protein